MHLVIKKKLWWLKLWYEESSTKFKALIRRCIKPWRLWWKQTLMDMSLVNTLMEADQFCLLLKKCRFSSSAILFVFFWPRAKQSFSKPNRMQQIIPKEAKETSSTIQQSHPLEAELSNLFKTSQGRLMRWQFFNNDSIIFTYKKNHEQFKKERDFTFENSAKTLINYIAHTLRQFL